MKRFLSILLCSAILAAAIPGMYYAEGNQSSYDELSQLKEIDYQLNGGHYVSGLWKTSVNGETSGCPYIL